MSTMLMDLMHHLQDVYSDHPDDDKRVIIALATPHIVEQFEVGEVPHDGPSVDLYCQPPLQDEEARPQDEAPNLPDFIRYEPKRLQAVSDSSFHKNEDVEFLSPHDPLRFYEDLR